MTHLVSCFPEGPTEEDLHFSLDGDVGKCGIGLVAFAMVKGELGAFQKLWHTA